jgi:signal peptide peptidase SppA
MEVAIAIGSRDEFCSDARERALAARGGKPLDNTRTVEMFGGVAAIPVQGTLFRHADLLSEISGGVSYATLRKDLQTALDDDSVQAIVLNVDSPGGEVNGMVELAAAIYEARSKKDVYAYVGGQGCSAAYLIASAAGKVVCSPTAMLGSIGVCTSFVDDSKAQEARGEKTVSIVSTRAPNKNVDPTTDRGRALVQDKLDAVEQVFIDAVAQYRGVAAQTVVKTFGQGGVRVGADAVSHGMADAVGSFESVLRDLSQRGAAAQTKRNFMAKEEELAAFERDVLVALGVKDRAAAMGAIIALQGSRAEAEQAKRDLATLKQSTVDAECKRMLDEATVAGRLPPAKRAEVEAMYGKYGLDVVKATLSVLPVVASSVGEGPRPVLAPAAGGDVEISAKEIEIAKNIVGSDPVALEKHLNSLREYKRARANGAGR